MKKVLISIVSNVSEEINEIYTMFYDKGYQIELFDQEQLNIQADTLPLIIDYVQSKEEYMNGIERLVICSNIRPLLFSWYRCYNSLVDDFIYFINQDDIERKYELSNISFVEALANFNGIEKENVEGTIYVNINPKNYKQITNFLVSNLNFSYCNSLDNFNFYSKGNKTNELKCYRYKGYDYRFQEIKQGFKEKTIFLEKSKNNLQIDSTFLQALIKNIYYIPCFTLMLLTIEGINSTNKSKILLSIFDHLNRLDIDSRDLIYGELLKYIRFEELGFVNKSSLLSLSAQFVRKQSLLKEIMSLLITDKSNIDYYYPFLMSTLFYESKNGLEVYEEVYHDREQVINKILNTITGTIKHKEKMDHQKKHILILVPQLLNLQHSPTVLALNYAMLLKKYNPDLEVKILVEDVYVYSPDELKVPYLFSSINSDSAKHIHKEFLKDVDVSIHYSDSTKNRKNRVEEDIRVIHSFNPEAVLMIGNSWSLIHRIIHDWFPIIYKSTGDIINGCLVDVFLSFQDEELIVNECEKFQLEVPPNIFKHTPGVKLPKPITLKTRVQYNFKESQFVMVTVGNRLDAEISEEFADLIGEFLVENKDSIWLIVGKTQLSYVRNNYKNLVEENRITFIDYEEDLASLYNICDVYINPFRKGGGYSVAIAMDQSLPIVTLYGKYDVAAWVGVENSMQNTQDYKAELTKLLKDKNYRENKGELMRRRIEKFDFQNSVRELLEYLTIAINRFYRN